MNCIVEEIKRNYIAYSEHDKITFYLYFVHFFTLSCRDRYVKLMSEQTEDHANSCLNSYRVMNEVMHSVSGQLLKINNADQKRYPDEAIFDGLLEIGENENWQDELEWALREALRFMTQKK